jgi:hypothetical protein
MDDCGKGCQTHDHCDICEVKVDNNRSIEITAELSIGIAQAATMVFGAEQHVQCAINKAIADINAEIALAEKRGADREKERCLSVAPYAGLSLFLNPSEHEIYTEAVNRYQKAIKGE